MSTRPSRLHFPISQFAMVMGMAGLALAWRAAGRVLELPGWMGEIWLWTAAAAFIFLLVALLRRTMAAPRAVRDEALDPEHGGLAACLPIGGSLLAGGLHHYVPGTAVVLWWLCAAGLTALQVALLARWLRGGLHFAQVNGSWMIVLLGGLPLALSGGAIGATDATRVMFGASLAVMPAIMTLVFARVVIGPPVAAAARPLWFVFLVPPALVYTGMPLLTGTAPGVGEEALLYLSLLTLAALAVASRDARSWPFGPAWWAFTFPLDAVAGAVARFAERHPGSGTAMLAAGCIGLAYAVVTLVFVRTLFAFARAPVALRTSPTSAE